MVIVVVMFADFGRMTMRGSDAMQESLFTVAKLDNSFRRTIRCARSDCWSNEALAK